MKNRIKNKLHSRTGASIMIALLLFLVCVVLSSVIITAATASAGRMSGLAETDQRYYAVTSASELMKTFLDGKTVSIVTVTTSYETTTYVDETPEGDPVPGDDDVSVYLIADRSVDTIKNDTDAYLLPIKQISGSGALGNKLKTNGIANEAAYRYFIEKQAISGRQLDMTSSVTTQAREDPLAVTVSEDMDTLGSIKLTIRNTTADSDDPVFAQQLFFSAAVHPGELVVKPPVESGQTIIDEWPDENDPEITHRKYKVTTATTAISFASITWSLERVKNSAMG